MGISISTPPGLLARLVLAALPDATPGRKRLLGGVVGALPRNHPTRLIAQTFLEILARQEQMRSELLRAARTSGGGQDVSSPLWRLHRCAREGHAPRRRRRLSAPANTQPQAP
jgi:hypothetical protein